MAQTARYDVAAKRYAEAVFGIARDSGTEDVWRDDLGTLRELVENPQAAAFLASGRTSEAQKRQLVEAVLRGAQPLALNLARLLLQRGRLGLAPQIAAEYDRMLDVSRGIEHAQVTTAVPLSDAERAAVEDRLRALTGAREVRLETRIDPSLIGGMTARVGDRLIDGSTRTRLLQLKRSLAGAAR